MKKTIEKISITDIAGLPGITHLRAHHISQEFDPHTHDEYVIGLIEAGNAVTRYNKQIVVLPTESVMTLNPGDVHSGRDMDGGVLSYQLFYIAPKVFGQLLSDPHRLPVFSSINISQQIHLSVLKNTFAILNSHHGLLGKQEATIELLQHVANYTLFIPSPLKTPSSICAIDIVHDYLQTYYNQPITIEELSRVAGLQRDYLIRAFHTKFGLPPYKYLLQIRIERSKPLLLSGKSIAEVANLVGFADQSHYSRFFKRFVGVSPGAFQKGHYRSRKSKMRDVL